MCIECAIRTKKREESKKKKKENFCHFGIPNKLRNSTVYRKKVHGHGKIINSLGSRIKVLYLLYA